MSLKNQNSDSREDTKLVLLAKCEELIEILEAEEETNWVRGLRAAVSELRETPEPTRNSWDRAISILNTMYGAKGGISDVFIWRDNPQERREANVDLSRIRKEIWEIVSSSNRSQE